MISPQLVGFLGAGLLRTLGATLRWRVRGDVSGGTEAAGGRLYAFWHGQLLVDTLYMRRHPVRVLISLHRDGEYIAQVVRRLGLRTVRGSTSRGGYRSLVELIRWGRAGEGLAISPDGPRGPRRKVQPGAILVAQRAGIPIIPIAGQAWPRRRLQSWDRFEIPLPFARAVVAFGNPLWIPPGGGAEETVARWAPRLEAQLNATSQEAWELLSDWVGGLRGQDE